MFNIQRWTGNEVQQPKKNVAVLEKLKSKLKRKREEPEPEAAPASEPAPENMEESVSMEEVVEEKATEAQEPEPEKEEETKEKKPPKREKKKKKKIEEPVEEEVDVGRGHSRVLNIFHAHAKPISQPDSDTELPDAPVEELDPELNPTTLQPLPQPAQKAKAPRGPGVTGLPEWLTNPTTIPSTTRIPFSELGLSSKINTRLATQNYTAAFAVQSAVLPALLKDAQSLVQGVKEDLCVSAQTGSGKTLAYTIPIVEALSTRVVTRLRCLIVLPTRELVTQVRETFEQIAGGSGLKIGTSTGQRSFANEQTMLCGQPTDKPLRGGKSLVDILICTPGRLVDHIQQTPNFTLQHLRWLVVDEADRLLNQSFQEWADVVMNEIDNPANLLSPEEEERGSDAVSGGVGRAGEGWISACQKCIFSATLSRNPGKIASLRLRRPRLIMVHDPAAPTEEGTAAEDGAAGEEMDGDDDDDEPKTFSVPAGLTEHALISGPEKPLFLVQLIKEKGIKGAFVFTKSNESAARLARLLVLMDPLQADKVGLYSGEVSKDERKKTLTAFKKGTIEILVCSDLLARGLDLPSVPHIINYDPPPSTRQYIHRVGRTARAGTSGDAWSLILPHEARFFWKMVRSVGRGGKKVERVEGVVLESLKKGVESGREGYESALEVLGKEVEEGRRGGQKRGGERRKSGKGGKE